MEQIFNEQNFGDLTIEEMISFSEQIQLMLTCKLIRISKMLDESNGKQNLYVFERVARPNKTPAPILVKVKTEAEANEAKKIQEDKGKKLIFDSSSVFVENTDVRVLGFR